MGVAAGATQAAAATTGSIAARAFCATLTALGCIGLEDHICKRNRCWCRAAVGSSGYEQSATQPGAAAAAAA